MFQTSTRAIIRERKLEIHATKMAKYINTYIHVSRLRGVSFQPFNLTYALSNGLIT